MWEGPAHCGCYVPGLVAMDSLRNQADQAMRNKAVNSTASRFLTNLNSWAGFTQCDSGYKRTLPPQVVVVCHGVITEIET